MEEKSQELLTIPLREEVLDIKKEWVKTEEITCRKEVLTEEKYFNIPVMREELIIERTFLNPELPGQPLRTEITRIPIREERVDIVKTPYDLEKVEINKQELIKTETINENIKKEILQLEMTGNVDLKTIL